MIANKLYEPYKVDIWSMGVVLFNLLTGDLPFEHKETNKLY